MMVKHAEQTTVKQQENTLSLRQTSKGGNNRNKNFRMSILHGNHSVAQNMVTFMKLKNKLLSLYTLIDRMEYLFRVTSVHSEHEKSRRFYR
jgi:hypothetical protein